MFLYYILVLSLPFVAHPLFGRTLGGITIEKILGVMCAVYAVFHLLASGRMPRFFAAPQTKAFLAFFILAMASFVADGTPAGRDLVSLYVAQVVLLFVTCVLVDSEARLRATLLVMVVAIFWSSLYVLREYQVALSTYGFGYRPGYVNGDPNYFSASAVMCFPLMLYFGFDTERGWRRILAWLTLGITGLALLVTASRGGFIGLVAALAVWLWGRKRRVRNLVALSALAVIMLAALPTSPLQRLLHPTASDSESSQNRLMLWRAGLRMFADHPFGGVGLGNFAQAMPLYGGSTDFRVAHNTYLEVAAETGLAGLLAFLAIIGSTMRNLRQTRDRAAELGHSFLAGTTGALRAGLVGFAVCMFFLSATFLKVFWFTVFVSGVAGSLTAELGSATTTQAAKADGSEEPENEHPQAARKFQDEIAFRERLY